MGKLRRLQPVAVALLACLVLSSCVGTRRPPFFGKRHKPVSGDSPKLKIATRDDLNAIISRTYDAIQSFQANASLKSSKGSVYESAITDYPALDSIILFRKPDDIRIHATIQFVSTVAFDMLSNGTDFRLSLPLKYNLFVKGLNAAPATSTNKMENLRPVAFLSSMLIRPWDPATEFAMLKDDTTEEDALYRLELNGKGRDGAPIPGREIWFDRLDLSIVRQKVYREDGNILSDTSYAEWQTYNGVLFPAHIDISRPIDAYGVAIEINKMEMNKELTNAQFVLEQPEGSTLKVIGDP